MTDQPKVSAEAWERAIEMMPAHCCWADKENIRDWIKGRANSLTATQPAAPDAGADPVRALVADWRDWSVKRKVYRSNVGERNRAMAKVFNWCADELEAALAAAEQAKEKGSEPVA